MSQLVNERLSLSTKIYYLFGDIGISMCIATVAFFMMFFYSDVAHIDPAIVGTVLLLAKIWDAVSDPLFGWISDRTRSKYGKRKIYMLVGAVPLGISFALLWCIPEGLSDTWVVLWLLGTFFLYFTFITVVSVSYYAMTPVLTRDYDERTSLTTFRMIGGSLGYMAGAALPTLIAGLFVTGKIGWLIMGAMFAGFAIICIYITTFGVKQTKELESPPSELPPIKSILICFKNRPFNYLILQNGITGMSFMLAMSFMAFFLTYQLDMKEQIHLVMTLFLTTILLFLFLWKWIADKWAKGPTYALGLFIAFSALAATFFLPQGKGNLIYLIVIISGIGMSAQWVLPWSILPDVVEYDEYLTGERREGMFYGLRGLVIKISDALGLFICGWVLKIYGFVPEIAQSPDTLFGIRLFFGPIPALLVFLSLPLLIWFPVDRLKHAEIRKKLEDRN